MVFLGFNSPHQFFLKLDYIKGRRQVKHIGRIATVYDKNKNEIKKPVFLFLR